MVAPIIKLILKKARDKKGALFFLRFAIIFEAPNDKTDKLLKLIYIRMRIFSHYYL
jgi:hypothetical protein